MTIAIVCITRQGYRLGCNVKTKLEQHGKQVDLFAPDKDFIDPAKTIRYHQLSELVGHLFLKYRQIIFIMALGIVVRMIASHIKDKATDPAVVVTDEAGGHVISVLAGHLGGANELAREVASLIGARPVITTATDVWGLPAVDDLARKYNLGIEPVQAIRKVNGALVNGGLINFYSDRSYNRDSDRDGDQTVIILPPTPQISSYRLNEYPVEIDHVDFHVVITNRSYKHSPANTLFLRPRNLVAGVGCRAGTSEIAILEAINLALATAGYSILSLRALATIDLKTAEPGLCCAARTLNLPLISFTAAEINDFIDKMVGITPNAITKSDFVRQHVGVPAVCEPAALLATGKGELKLPKQKFQGITIALAEDQ